MDTDSVSTHRQHPGRSRSRPIDGCNCSLILTEQKDRARILPVPRFTRALDEVVGALAASGPAQGRYHQFRLTCSFGTVIALIV
ncbi:hypothetical protein Amal_03365 [Acetobacter malorum]|uniref:Uncharacterized protein n=1 Tax=Acetobacter malorum TaxID=178901 RepID=A0A177G7X0_9PROT|nr:hypothetical protein Amal_03365 [Acetobacter malorum]